MTVTRNVILQIIAVIIFAIAAILGFGWLGANSVAVEKLLSIVALGLAFHAAAHL